MDELEALRKKRAQELMDIMNAPDKPVEITDANFQEMIAKYPLLMVDCWAQWCGPCRMIAPVIEELAKEYAGKVTFGKLDVDNHNQVAGMFRVNAIPTILVLKDGELIDQIIGAVPKQQIISKINSYLSM